MPLVRALRQSAHGVSSRIHELDGRRTMMMLYRLNSGSTIVSLNNIPSVMYLIFVRSGDQRSSNRIEYPT